MLIKSINWVLLAVVLIGLPAVAGMRFGNLQVSSLSLTHELVTGGLCIALTANALGGFWLAKDRKSRRLCRGWAIGFAALLALESALYLGYVNFDWLRQPLSWTAEKL